MEYHPHVHYVVPGGGPSPDGERWLPSRAHFFVPVKALSKIFRGIFREAIQRAGLAGQVDPAVWRKDWVVHSQAAGDGRASLRYLAPYVFRVAIGDHRIRSCEDGRVTFTYRRSGSRRWRTMRLEAHEFLRRFLQHVLPRGFQKVRYFGFASPNARASLESARWLATLHAGARFTLRAEPASSPTPAPPPMRCGECGGRLYVVAFVRCRTRVVFDTS
ncbi:MAG: transposase [Longimicrobiaceae bacterium]